MSDDTPLRCDEAVRILRQRGVSVTHEDAFNLLGPIEKTLTIQQLNRYVQEIQKPTAEDMLEYYRSVMQGPDNLYPIESLMNLCYVFEPEMAPVLKRFLISLSNEDGKLNLAALIKKVSPDRS